MYAAARPLATFTGAMLATYLTNLPPSAPPVQDFSLDLGQLLYSIVHAIQVDIKCPAGESQHTAERVAQLISTALSELSL
jgi:hypothetical protein